MFFGALQVPRETTAAGVLAFERARGRAGVKLQTLAALMGISYQQVQQWASGIGHPSMWRLLMLASDVDGRRFLGCLLQEVADCAGVEDLDGIAARVAELTAALGRRRMVKADLGHSVSDRRSA